MPTCSKCNNWVFSSDRVCPTCGHVFNHTSSGSARTLESVPDTERDVCEGVVYLLKADRHYKIGKTNSFERRYKQIKLQLPFDAEEVHQIRTNNINKLESHWHRRFRNKRKNGEWFELTESDLEEFTSVDQVIYK